MKTKRLETDVLMHQVEEQQAALLPILWEKKRGKRSDSGKSEY